MKIGLKQLISVSIIACGVSIMSCQSNSTEKKTEVNANFSEEDLGTTTMEFDSVHHDFGPIPQGEKVTYKFPFTNTGENDLMLKSVKASCGCTIPKWTKEPIAPGEKGVIEVVFNTQGRKGKQHKTITINTNTDPGTILLTFNAEVVVTEEKQ